MPYFDAPTLSGRSRVFRGLVIPAAFFLILYSIDLACIAFLPTSPIIENIYATNFALPFDLAVVIPATFFFLIVRRRKLSPLIMLPIIWVGIAVSLLFVQTEYPSIHLILLPVAAVIDVIIFVWEGRRFARAFRAAQKCSENPHTWFSRAFFKLTNNERASHIAANEMVLWYYLLASWRRKPNVPLGHRAFTCHKASGYVSLIGVIVVLTCVETFAVHLLVAQWNDAVAIALSAASVYTAIFLVGNARAVVLNPMLVGNDTLSVRWGMFVNEDIALSNIARVQSQEPDLPKQERMNLGVMGAQPCWIVLHEAILAQTFTGKQRSVRAINVSPDEMAAFKKLFKQQASGEPPA